MENDGNVISTEGLPERSSVGQGEISNNFKQPRSSYPYYTFIKNHFKSGFTGKRKHNFADRKRGENRVDIIQLLPDSIANQIAAGEVIQRPASAVKELLENAVDAGATEIKLIVQDAGKALIQVIDNGKGMSETDARLSF